MSKYYGRDVDNISNVEKLDNITFDGGTTYALEKSSVAYTPSGANNILISIDGVVQQGNFSVSTTNIVFDWSPTSSNTCDWILHYGTGLITTPADGTVTLAKMAVNSIDSDQYVDASIDNAHLADDAVGVAELSATGTASSSTFLRGDNAWASAGGNYVLLGQAESTSDDATISIQDKFTTTYDFYTFYLVWKQTDDGSDTRFRWLTSGSTQVSGSYYIYTADRHEINTSSSTTHAIDHSGYNENYAQVTNHLVADSEDYFYTLNLTFYNPYKGTPINRAKVMGEKTYVRTDDVWRGGTFMIDYNEGDSDNYGGFKLWPSTGYMTDYKYQLYGIKGS